MELLEASVRVFVEALTVRQDLTDSADALAKDMLEVARRSGPEGLERAVATLAGALPLAFSHEARVALLIGALVELGADPNTAAKPLVEMLSRTLRAAQTFAAACEDAAEAVNSEEVTPTMRGEVAKRLPEPAAAEAALNNVCLGALSALTRSAEARELARSQPRMELRARALAPMHKGAHLLWLLLSTIEEEELLVLHPSSARGWRVCISEIVENRQLHLLLAGALPDSSFDGARPAAATLAAASDGDATEEVPPAQSIWTLYQWQALHQDGSLPVMLEQIDAFRDLVPHLGVPCEIERFEGMRVVLLGPVLKERRWNSCRPFHELHASVKIVETLKPDTVRAWLSRMVSTKK